MKISALPLMSRLVVRSALLCSGLLALGVLFPTALMGQSLYSTPYTITTLAGLPGVSGTNDGTGSAAQFKYPVGLARDTNGNLYVADWGNSTIRMVTPAGAVTTLAGLPGVSGTNDGTGNTARFNDPEGVAVDGETNIYVADRDNNEIRKVSPIGTNWMVTTLAGLPGSQGTNDGTNGNAQFHSPTGVALDVQGNVYVTDFYNNSIRKLAPSGTNWVVTTLAGLPGSQGTNDGTNSGARFNGPWGLAVGTNGELYMADFYNNTIRKATPSGTNWVVTTLAGLPGAQGTNDGTNGNARFYFPAGVALDNKGDVYVADSDNFTIRIVTSSGTNWVVTTLAGEALKRGNADGTGSAALFNTPTGVVLDSATNVYVTDFYNHTIREGLPAGSVSMPVLQAPGLDGGLFGFRIIGVPNLAVDLQGSIDMVNWQVMGTVVLTGGSNYFSGPSPPLGNLFYRAHVR